MIQGARFFGFVKTEDIQRLAGFCLGRKDRPWITVVIASFLRKGHARALLGSLPPEMQGKVALTALTQKPIPQERVEALESDVRAFLDIY